MAKENNKRYEMKKEINNMKFKLNYNILSLLFVSLILLLVIPGISAYSVSNNYNPLGSFLGGNIGSSPGNFDTSKCQAGQDFIVQIAPFGCTPAVVRSDLLEEQNVPVFCQLSATKINPLIDVNYINYISITGQYPSSVSTVGFHPAQSALQPATGKINTPLLNNLGYAAIVLRQQPNESAMPDYVEGNLTVNIKYDIQNAFGVGKVSYYLPLISDEDDWNNKYVSYGFWNGKGFLRANSINPDSASISLYAGASTYDSGEVKRQSTIDLKKGEVSGEIPVYGFDFCYANLKLKLDDVVNPTTRAQLKINGDLIEVAPGETFMDGKCSVTSVEKIGVGERVNLRCQEDGNTGLFSSSTSFGLSRNPRINISLNGIEKSYGIGDYLFDAKDENGNSDGYVYVGYIGSGTGSFDSEDLFMYLVKTKEKRIGIGNNLTAEDISSAATLSDYYTSSSKSGVVTIDLIKDGIAGVLRFGQSTLTRIFTGKDYFLYKFSDGEQNVHGTSFEIKGFSNPINVALDDGTKKYYDDAVSDYEEIINSYSNEKYNNVELGENAFVQEIELASSLGQKRTMLELCNVFKEQYPTSSYYSTSDCNNGLRLSSSASSSKVVVINGKTKIISLEGVYNPSLSEYGARVKVDWEEKDASGKINYYTETFDLTKDKSVIFGLNGEKIQLTDIEDDRKAVILVNVPSGSSVQGVLRALTSSKESLEIGTTKIVSSYKFTLLNVNIQKVAKVSVIPNIDYAGTEVTFPFKIGIEKRGIKLSPEKTTEKIQSLNSSIEQWNKISDKLGKTVQGLKAVCLATEGLFTVQNFLANLGGEGLARAKVMRDAGGWYDKCDDLVKQGLYATSQACLFSNSDEIETQVAQYTQIINNQNSQIKSLQEGITTNDGLFSSDNVDTDEFVEKYAPVVSSAVSSLGNINNPNGEGFIDANKAAQQLGYNIWSSKNGHNYEVNELREIGFYSSVLKTNPNDKGAQAKLYSLLSDLNANSKAQAKIQEAADSLNIASDKIGFLSEEGSKKLFYHGLTSKDIFGTGTTPIEVVQLSSNSGLYYVYLDNSETKILNIQRDADGLVIYSQNSARVTDSKVLDLFSKVYFERFDSSTYKNTYKNPELKYYETEPYKGYPAIVPFDKTNGWYVGVRQTLPVFGNIASYDSSGRAASFYLCNVGVDGKEEFLSESKDDYCQLINLAQRATFNQFYGLTESEINSLVNKAVNAVEVAQRAYKDGVDKVSINGVVYDVGEPASNLPEMICTDFMSASQCQILFNVCDPVICPSSRCDLGGQYPVRDVIQSGVVGSIALCLPNVREGIVMPVCLTGIQAGLDSWNSVLKSYRDCLQENLDTGATTGICDEINSVYTCEFFWKQGLPIAQVAVPKIVESLLGQNSHGGGEYLSVQNAWTNAQKSVDFFTQHYAANSFTAFKARSLEEAGTPICQSYVSAVYPGSGDLINSLTQPDSPPQFTGRFDEILFTTQTNPPQSQYKVFYHIYAGKDSGVYYSVYLKGVPGSSYYQDTSINRIVDSGYISVGDYETNTVDFTATAGYSQMCIVVNGQEECGFKEVSTDFAVTYVKDQYLAEQSSRTDITSESSCVSGDASIYSFLNPNLESTANSLIDPQIYNRGITRICATNNPGKGTDKLYGQEGQRWIEVGYCGDQTIKCWLDTQTVKDTIEISGIEESTLQKLTEDQLKLLQGTDYSKKFAEEIRAINNEEDQNKKVDVITSLIQSNKFFFNQQIAYLLFLRGNALSELAKISYKPVNDGKTAEQLQDELNASAEDALNSGLTITPLGSSDNTLTLEEIDKREPPIAGESSSPVSVRIILNSDSAIPSFLGVGDLFVSDVVYNWDNLFWTLGNDKNSGLSYSTGLSKINEIIYENEGKKQFSSVRVLCGDKVIPVATSFSLFSVDVISGIDKAIRDNCDVKASTTSSGNNQNITSENSTTGTPESEEETNPSELKLSCDTQEECQQALGNEIIKIAKEFKIANREEIDDVEVQQQTGAKNFECLVLQLALHESLLNQCGKLENGVIVNYEENGNPLYCDGNLDLVLKSGVTNENSYGVFQLNQKYFSTATSKVFRDNVEAGIKHLIFYHQPGYSNSYICNGKTYGGWNAAIRRYNGWTSIPSQCSSLPSSSKNYVENVLSKKTSIQNLFPETCGDDKYLNSDTALLVIDISKDVTYEGTKYSEELKTEIPKIINVIDNSNKANWNKIVFYLGPEENTREDLKNNLEAGGREPVYLNKDGDSAFCVSSLDPLLRSLKVNKVVLVGLNSGACVYATAKDAVSKGYEVITSRDVIMPDSIFDGTQLPDEKVGSENGPTYGEIKKFYLEKTTFFENYEDMLNYLDK